jgi:hypothetical protein
MFLVIMPGTSFDEEYINIPNLDNLPYEGFMEYNPQQ